MDPIPIIRPYVDTDFDSILQLLRLNTPQYFSPEEEPDLVHYLRNEIESYFVITVDGKVAAGGGINFLRNKSHALLSWDIVHPTLHGKGLGTLLIKHRLDLLQNIPTVEKISVRTSQLSYNFYEKSGFRIVDTIKDYWAEGFDLYSMQYHK